MAYDGRGERRAVLATELGQRHIPSLECATANPIPGEVAGVAVVAHHDVRSSGTVAVRGKG
jgi:hypothetical protein